MLSALEPLFDEILSRLMPRAVQDMLGPSIVEELAELAAGAADQPVTILVAPDSEPALAQIMQATTALPYRMVTDPALAEGQVFFRLGDHERAVDTGAMIDRIADRIAAFNDENHRILKHG